MQARSASPFLPCLTVGARLCLVALSAGLVGAAHAAGADIANAPLAYATSAVKPNVMFILDDSGSMGSDYMPDDMSWPGYFGYYASQCNGLAFNPNVEYKPPLKADGTSYPNASFSNAWNDGFNTGAGTVNLGDNTGVVDVTAGRRGYTYVYGYRHYYVYTGTQPAMNWTYSASGSVDTSTTFYGECNSWINSANGTTTPGSGVFTEYLIKDQSSTVQQNYANWYSYYRKRLLTMRTAAGRAFASLDSNYRIGFTMISDSSVSGSNFLNVSDFDSTQKAAFYNKLYTSYSGSYTPLRGALSKVGRYYANQISGQTDPVQYSCQRNYALLSTDGYWNNQIETASYGPYQLDGSTEVGNQDGTEDRPMKDGTTTTTTRTVVTNVTTPTTYTGTWVTSTVYQRTNTVIQACTRRGSPGRNSYTYVEQRTDTSSAPRTWATSVLSHDTITTVTINGVSGTPTTTPNTPAPTTTTVSDTYGTAVNATGTWSTVSTGRTSSCDTSSTATTGTTFGTASVYNTSTAWRTGDPTTTTGTVVVGASTTTENTVVANGDSNSLADVAEFYWKNDLRPTLANNVPTNSTDPAAYQHMNTFTLGLGVRGTLAYDANYQTQTTGDFAALKAGTKDWPVPSGTLGRSEDATHIDDLWHAAVNGRGQYFSALDPSAVSASISSALSTIKAETGTASAAAASSLTPVSGDDWIFLPSYTTLSWTGDVRSFKYTFSGGKAVPPSDTSAGSEIWSAKAKLDARVYTDRTVYFNNAGTLARFTYTNLTTAGRNGLFDNRCTTVGASLSQCASLTSTALAKVTGANLVNYLAGDKSLYLNSTSSDDQVFRTRASLFGDIGNASPVYVGKPPFQYTDTGYSTFVTNKASRTKMVYAAANDGMLHAIKVGTDALDTEGGKELWAFVPTAVMPELWRLASNDYANNHRYYVDSTPTVADVYDSSTSAWRTILVGGFGAGGRGYYALDITTPESPALLWEISNASTGYDNLGLTYGNPIITKDKTGRWIVVFTSGLNNHTNGGNGVGRLYVANALTGERLSEVVTTAGSATTPNNLSRIEGWVETISNNTALRFYGGDMLGNLWRFDHDDLIAPTGSEALLLGKAQTSGGTVQPITVKPLLMSMTNSGTSIPVVLFGTGRYLGANDLTDTTTQTIYAVKDSLGSTGLDVLRTGSDALVQQTLNSSRAMTTPAALDWSSQNGWYVDLDVATNSGERVFVNPISLGSATVQFATGITTGTSECTPGGSSWLYTFNLKTGVVLSAAQKTFLVIGQSEQQNPDGTNTSLTTDIKGNLEQRDSQPGSLGTGTLKRAMWRELIN